MVAFDIHPRTQTMSGAFAAEGTHGKRAYQFAWVCITLHLWRFIPDRYDPLRRFDLLRWKMTQGGNT